VFKVPDELSDEVLGPVNCAMGTVTQGLTVAGIHEGQSVVIQGAGGLGLTATAMAKDMGADRVIVLDRLENRLRLAEEFGADYTINIEEYKTPESRIQRIKELTRDRGADVVMELVGYAPLLPEGIAMLTNGGTFVEIGLYFSGQTVPFDPSTLVLTGKRIMGSVMYRPILMSTILDFLVRTRHKLPFHTLISHKFKLADVNEAFAQAEWHQRQTPITRAVLVP
jgi:L-iditol 2-dehydrogenase